MIYEKLDEFVKNITSKARILGFDYGTKRIGFAVSDILQKVATPSGTINYEETEQALSQIMSILKDYNSNVVVFGLPLHMDGSEGELCVKVREFVGKLCEKNNLNILFYDERMSSCAAYSLLYDTDLTRKQKDKISDKIAASFILQGVLDSISNLRKGLFEEAV